MASRRRYTLVGPDGIPIETFTNIKLAEPALRKAPEGSELRTSVMTMVGERAANIIANRRWRNARKNKA